MEKYKIIDVVLICFVLFYLVLNHNISGSIAIEEFRFSNLFSMRAEYLFSPIERSLG